jgi:hypothetical protein
MKYKMTTFGMSNGDLAIKNGKFSLVGGKDCYLIEIHTAVKTLKGEILLAPSMGIPYFDTVFNVDHVNGIYVWAKRVRDLVMSFDFVESIISFDYSVSDRMILNYTLVVKTDDGIVTDTSQMSSEKDDSDIPTFVSPLAGQKLKIDTDENLAESTERVANEIGVHIDGTETLEDQFASTKQIVKSLGGETIDYVGDVVYNNDIPPYKPLDGSTIQLETDEDLRTGTKTIIEVLGGKTE